MRLRVVRQVSRRLLEIRRSLFRAIAPLQQLAERQGEPRILGIKLDGLTQQRLGLASPPLAPAQNGELGQNVGRLRLAVEGVAQQQFRFALATQPRESDGIARLHVGIVRRAIQRQAQVTLGLGEPTHPQQQHAIGGQRQRIIGRLADRAQKKPLRLGVLLIFVEERGERNHRGDTLRHALKGLAAQRQRLVAAAFAPEQRHQASTRLRIRRIELERAAQAPLGTRKMTQLGLHDAIHTGNTAIVGRDAQRALQLRLGLRPAPRRDVELREVDQRLQIVLVAAQRPAEELLGLGGVAGARLAER